MVHCVIVPHLPHTYVGVHNFKVPSRGLQSSSAPVSGCAGSRGSFSHEGLFFIGPLYAHLRLFL